MASCINKSLPAYKQLLGVYNDPVFVTHIINLHQKRVKSDSSYPTLIEASVIAKDLRIKAKAAKEEIKDVVIGNLKKLGVIAGPLKGQYYIKRTAAGQREADGAVISQNLRRANHFLSLNGLFGAISFVGGKHRMVINTSSLPTELQSKQGSTNLMNIIAQLNSVIPSVKIEVVSQQEAKDIIDNIKEDPTVKPNFEKIRSFYYKGTAYLIAGRVNNDIAIEEVLHPFVDALKKDNEALYTKLLAEATKNFPGLRQRIVSAYPKEDVDTELVTQALSKHMANQFELQGGVSRSFKDAFDELKQWIADLFKKIYELVKYGGDTVDITPAQLTQANNLSSIAKILGLNDVTISFDPNVSERIRYSLAEDRKEEAGKLFKSATEAQRMVADMIAFKDARDVQLIDSKTKNHIYVDVNTGEEYLSVTEGIKGVMPAEIAEEKAAFLFFGNKFDFILESIAFNKSFDEIQGDLEGVNLEVAREAYDIFKEQIDNLRSDGSILLPQVIFSHPASGRAGSADIVMIHTDGSISILDLKTSKNDLLSDAYDFAYPVKSEDSVFFGEKMSTRRQHSIQIAAYARMAEEMGITVRNLGVLALQVEYNQDQTAVTGIVKKDGKPNFDTIVHFASDNKTDIDKLLGSETYIGKTVEEKTNPVRNAEFLKDAANPETVEDKKATQGESFTEEEKDRILEFVMSTRGKLQTRSETLRQLVSSAKTSGTRKKLLHKLTGLLVTIDNSLSRGEINKAFYEILKFTKEDIEYFIDFANNPKNLNSYSFPTFLNFYNTSFKTYEGFKDAADLLRIENKELRNFHADIISLLNSAGEIAQIRARDYVKNLVKTKTKMANLYADETELDKAIESMLTVVKDIGQGAYSSDDIGSTGASVKPGITVKVETSKGVEEVELVQDRLLPLVKILYFEQLEKRNNIVTAVQEAIREEGNILVEASKAAGVDIKTAEQLYGFMLDIDEDGKYNGRYVRNIGPQFFKLYYEVKKSASSTDGELLKYHEVANGDLSPELAKENIEIYKKRQAFDDFKKPERTVGRMPVDGEYFKYIDAFKAERNKYEMWDGYTWVKRSGTSDADYAIYKSKHYDLNVPYTKKVFKNGLFTGETYKYTGDFVKREHVEIREISEKGEDMRNDKYKKLVSDTSTLGLARKRFYDFYVDQMENKLLSKLPTDTYLKMMGKIGRMERNLVKDAMKRPGEISSMMMRGIKDRTNFNSEVYAKTAVENEAGQLISTPPIFFVSDLQNQKKIESLEEKLKELAQDFANKKISLAAYNREKEKFSSILKAEKSRLTADKLEFDLVKNLSAFTDMVENYYQMEAVEDTINAIGRVIADRKYIPAGGEVSKILKGSGAVNWTEKGQSFTEKRLNKWMEMVFYDDKGHEKSVMDKVTDKILNATSLTYVGFNIFGNINNLIMGTINNAIETAGGQFYGRKAMLRANKEFGGAITGFLEGLGSKDGKYYSDKRPRSKYEALVNDFRIVRRFQSGEGRPESSLVDWAYILQEGGEYMVQSKTGVAVLMSTMIKNDKGEEMSLYDAMDFNEQTGKLSLKQGFNLTEEEKSFITLRIYDINRYIHGNYSYIERTVLQQYWWGKLIMQFHKWVVPAFQARFRAGYESETLGFIEGRYRTLWSFLGHVAKEKGNIVRAFNEAKVTYSEAQIANMYKILVEFGFFMASLAMYSIFDAMVKDVDDDDILTKRFLNAMKYQASKQQAELTTFIKPTEYVRLLTSPVASSRSLKEYGEVIEGTAQLAGYGMGLVDEKDVVYERGSRKGDYKLEKQLGDAVPLWYTFNRWTAYDTVDEFGVYK